MNEIAILVQPIDYPLDLEKLQTCFNCGSTIFRVQREGETEEDSGNQDVELYCAQCGTHVLGYHFPPINLRKEESIGKEEI